MCEYMTIQNTSIFEIVEKKSRFIGYSKHVESEEEAFQYIQSIRSKHWDAKHHVYAYIIGGDCNIQRSTDDGEPAGTAGRPVLEVINSFGITDTVVVIVRYFGGILLGTGGLVRAYSSAAKGSLENASLVKAVAMTNVLISSSYDYAGKIQNLIIKNNIMISNIDYYENVLISCLVRDDKLSDFTNLLSSQFTNHFSMELSVEKQYCFFPISE